MEVKKMLPRRIVPTEVLFGAIVSGNCVSACDKNTTYHHQNNPIILELLRGHGKKWDFVGCVITNENVTLGDKQRSSSLAAERIVSLGPDGVVVSKEGFGNPDADLMMNCSKIELGLAADWESPGVSNRLLFEKIKASGLPFDQLILELHDEEEPQSGWIHLGYSDNPRGQTLAAFREAGKTSYRVV